MDRVSPNGVMGTSGTPSISSPDRRLATFHAMNAHSQGGEPPLSFVIEFNAAEREWRESTARLLEDLENSLRAVPVPKIQK
jgi:hypothetical protein